MSDKATLLTEFEQLAGKTIANAERYSECTLILRCTDGSVALLMVHGGLYEGDSPFPSLEVHWRDAELSYVKAIELGLTTQAEIDAEKAEREAKQLAAKRAEFERLKKELGQ